MLESLTPSSVLQSVQYRRLEFLLNVYFAVYPLRRGRQQGSAAGYMAAFRSVGHADSSIQVSGGHRDGSVTSSFESSHMHLSFVERLLSCCSALATLIINKLLFMLHWCVTPI